MTFLDRTELDGHRRCLECEVTGAPDARLYRQCLRDDAHVGRHDYGTWLPLPARVTLVQKADRRRSTAEDAYRALAAQVDELEAGS